MDARTKIGILLIVYAVQVTLSAPAWDSVLGPGYRVRRATDKETGRIFWSAVGDILESLPFLPITLNVPDIVSAIWNYMTGFFPGGSSGTKRPKKNSTLATGVTRDDLIDYILY